MKHWMLYLYIAMQCVGLENKGLIIISKRSIIGAMQITYNTLYLIVDSRINGKTILGSTNRADAKVVSSFSRPPSPISCNIIFLVGPLCSHIIMKCSFRPNLRILLLGLQYFWGYSSPILIPTCAFDAICDAMSSQTRGSCSLLN